MSRASSSRAAPSSSSSSGDSGRKQLPPLKNSSDYRTVDEEIRAILAHLAEPAPTLDTGFDRVVVVDNLPKTPKVAALTKALQTKMKEWKALPQWPAGSTPDDDFSPVTLAEEAGTTLGYCFVEYPTAAAAAAAVEVLNGKAFDLKHKLRANIYTDVEKYSRVPDEFVPPAFEANDLSAQLRSWLLEDQLSDQYAVGYGQKWTLDIIWNETKSKPEPIMSKQDCEKFTWSPQGSYLATFHGPGVILWSGPKFGPPIRFKHEDVDRLEFSPGENFLITCAPEGVSGGSNKQAAAAAAAMRSLVIWDVRTVQMVNKMMIDGKDKTWPLFKWSHNDKYFARMNENGITVIDTTTMKKVVDPQSGKPRDIAVPKIADFSWSPSRNILAVFVQSEETRPARVELIEVPSRRVLQTRTVFNVDSCSFHWHPQGDYLCALMGRVRSKKKRTTNVELFRMRQKDIPIDSLELPEELLRHNEAPLFSWEPHGTHFLTMQRDASTRTTAILYNVLPDKIEQVAVVGQEKQLKANNFHWAPTGRFVVFSGLGQYNGHLEFYDVQERQTVGEADHFSATSCCWDPTGRYFTSYVTLQQQMENGFIIWSFTGKQIWKVLKDKFRQFEWRPRPHSLLKASQLTAIKRNLPKYAARYLAEDVEAAKIRRQRFFEEREAMVRAFRQLESDIAAHWSAKGYVPHPFDRASWRTTTETVDIQVGEAIEEYLD